MPLASLVIRIYRLPALVRLRPGQEMRLSVDAPFRFYLPPSSPRGFWGLNGKSRLKSGEGGLCSTLLLKPLQEGFSKVEVRLFGLPLRRLKVDVLKLPAVHVGGHAIGVLLSEEGVVVVGHIPLKDIDGRERYPAKEAGIKAGDIILSINGRQIDHITQLEDLVQSEAGKGQPLQLRIRRGKTVRRVSLSPVRQLDAGQRLSYRMGIYVEDPAAGVGTLTFYSLTHRFLGLWATGSWVLASVHCPWPREGGLFWPASLACARASGVSPGKKWASLQAMMILLGKYTIIRHMGFLAVYVGSLPAII